MNFLLKLETAIKDNNSLLCIGLDSDIDKLPGHLKNEPEPLVAFNTAIIDATHDLVSSYKINSAFYEAHGVPGVTALKQTIDYIRKINPGIPIIYDAKRADIGSTSDMYAKAVFDYLDADSITVSPYLGHDGLEPFFRRSDKGVIILCRTSNPGAKDFQDLQVYSSSDEQSEESRSSNGTSSPRASLGRTINSLYMKVAEKIVEWNKLYGNCLLVVGATYPEEMGEIRKIAPNMFFLVPGIGAQGGDVQKTLEAGLRLDKSGLLIHSSRAIIYASNGKDFTERARKEAIKLRDEINKYRK